MQLFRFVLLAGSMTAITACGGSTEKPAPDAGPIASTISGLGQSCRSPADCPPNASSCITYDDTGNGICSPVCLTGGTMMTNAAGAVATVTPDPGMAPQSTVCTSSYSQPNGKGIPSCETFVQYTPMERPVLANKTYTDVKMVCAIVCVQGETCPAPLHCDATLEWCVP
jgi:hypothetical protein